MAKIRLPKIRINPHRIADLALDAVRESEALGGPGETRLVVIDPEAVCPRP